jgi:hypothetical protein
VKTSATRQTLSIIKNIPPLNAQPAAGDAKKRALRTRLRLLQTAEVRYMADPSITLRVYSHWLPDPSRHPAVTDDAGRRSSAISRRLMFSPPSEWRDVPETGHIPVAGGTEWRERVQRLRHGLAPACARLASRGDERSPAEPLLTLIAERELLRHARGLTRGGRSFVPASPASPILSITVDEVFEALERDAARAAPRRGQSAQCPCGSTESATRAGTTTAIAESHWHLACRIGHRRSSRRLGILERPRGR